VREKTFTAIDRKIVIFVNVSECHYLVLKISTFALKSMCITVCCLTIIRHQHSVAAQSLMENFNWCMDERMFIVLNSKGE